MNCAHKATDTLGYISTQLIPTSCLMHSRYQPVIDAIDNLRKAVKAQSTETRSLMETNGWQFPALDCVDLQFAILELRDLVVERSPLEPDSEDVNVESLASRIALLQSALVPYLFNGNGNVGVPVLMTSLSGIGAWLRQRWPERESIDPHSLPFRLARKAKTAKSQLDSVLSGVSELDSKIRTINEAHLAAESLPTDLEDLRQLRTTLTTVNGQAAADAATVKASKTATDECLAAMQEAQKRAQALVDKCEEAYQITTTKGLAGAFDQRATSLARSMWVWVAGLVAALVAVALIGHNRVGALTQILAGDPKWGTVTLNFLLSAISVGAPLWFAWVATKQIGQRFRLAEDYGFKASVAKAYEGYRKQAIEIDPKFESQLFGIALSRLEEAPLRMVEPDTHGSPWHEVISSLQKSPSLRDKVVALVRAERSPGSRPQSAEPLQRPEPPAEAKVA